MKLSDLLPQLPRISEYEKQLSHITGTMSQIYKANGGAGGFETYRSPTLGMDQLVNHWLRQQAAYRQQLVMDLITIALTTEEVASPVHHIISEVFRKGIQWAPAFHSKCRNCNIEYQDAVERCRVCKSEEFDEPDEKQKEKLSSYLDDANIWDKSLEDVLKGFAFNLNVIDDAFLYLSKEYTESQDGGVRSKVVEIKNLNPALIEFDLDQNGLPKNSHFLCYIHRDIILSAEPGKCPECNRTLIPAMYAYRHRGKVMYLFDSEIIHTSKFYPGNETYGWSPLLTIFEKVLTIIGMDRCYDEETEVLTRDGWKYFRDVNYSDEFATLGIENALEYQKPTYINSYMHNGKMYQLKHRAIDLLVTPFHRMYVRGRNDKEYGYKEAHTIEGQPVAYYRGGANWTGQKVEKFILPAASYVKGPHPSSFAVPIGDLAEFLGVWYSVGRIQNRNVVFSSSEHRDKIARVVSRIPVSWSDASGGKYIQGGSRALVSYLSDFSKDKSKLLSAISDFPEGAKHKFFDAAIETQLVHPRAHAPMHDALKADLRNFRLSFNGKTDFDVSQTVQIASEGKPIDFGALEIDMNLWLEFLGYWLSEGSFARNGTGIKISQNPGWKKDKMWHCLRQMPFKWNDNLYSFSCSDVRLNHYVSQFGHAADKFIPREFLELPKEQLQILFDALMLGDSGVTNSPRLRDDMMEMAVKMGMGVTYSIKKYSKPGQHETYYLKFAKKKKEAQANYLRKQDSWVDYNGMVYCVEVPNTNLLVRRNGKIVWSGNTLYRYFWERKMPSAMIFVFTDDVDSIRSERAEIEAKLRLDPTYVPMIGVQSRTNRGRVDMVRLFHTLQEMEYVPVRQEIRERIASLWGVTPMWQGSLEASGGIASQTQQLVVMSRVVEGDQRIFHEKVFPQICEAFGITDWKLELPQPEEMAESTRLQFAMQRIAGAAQLLQMGFDVEARSQDGSEIDDINFKISGKAKSQIDQQKEMMAAQQEQQQALMGGGGGGGNPFGGGGSPSGEIPGQEGEQALQGLLGASAEGENSPGESSNIPSFLQRQQEKSFFTKLSTTPNFINDLLSKGFSVPMVKSISSDGTSMTFESRGKTYTADMEDNRIVNISKAASGASLHQHNGLPIHPISAVHQKQAIIPKQDVETLDNPYSGPED